MSPVGELCQPLRARYNLLCLCEWKLHVFSERLLTAVFVHFTNYKLCSLEQILAFGAFICFRKGGVKYHLLYTMYMWKRKNTKILSTYRDILKFSITHTIYFPILTDNSWNSVFDWALGVYIFQIIIILHFDCMTTYP